MRKLRISNILYHSTNKLHNNDTKKIQQQEKQSENNPMRLAIDMRFYELLCFIVN